MSIPLQSSRVMIYPTLVIHSTTSAVHSTHRQWTIPLQLSIPLHCMFHSMLVVHSTPHFQTTLVVYFTSVFPFHSTNLFQSRGLFHTTQRSYLSLNDLASKIYNGDLGVLADEITLHSKLWAMTYPHSLWMTTNLDGTASSLSMKGTLYLYQMLSISSNESTPRRASVQIPFPTGYWNHVLKASP